MKISFITTIYNEEKTIIPFLKSVINQSYIPDEIIVADGGSTDQTIDQIKKFQKKFPDVPITLIHKKGNRSVGRNAAIGIARGAIIACSDAGNELDAKWLATIIKPFKEKSVDVVAGYYKASTDSLFQECVSVYFLVMPDHVNPATFLPATRSMAFTKKIWKKAGKFDETLSHNEDYVFARRLRTIGAKIVFEKNAIVYWNPPHTITSFLITLFRFAYGDAQALVFRPKVSLILLRYLIASLLIYEMILKGSFGIAISLLMMFILYCVWSVQKNYKYIQKTSAWVILPYLQFVSDFAVISGTISGIGKKIWDILFWQ